METTKKYCEDCRFFVHATSGLSYSRCGAPGAQQIGNERFVARELDQPPYCSTMRVAQCGPEAKWFEDKQAVAAE